MTSGHGSDRLNLFPTSAGRDTARFAQLAIGSNSTLNQHTEPGGGGE